MKIYLYFLFRVRNIAPLRVRTRLCKLQKRVRSTRNARDKAYQLLAHGRWFSPGIPASSTTKTGCHDIAEILMKVALNTINQIKSNQSIYQLNHLCGVMARLLVSGVVDHGGDQLSGQTNDYHSRYMLLLRESSIVKE